MKRLLLSLAAISVLTSGMPGVAFAQSWVSINQRQAMLESRIDQGIKNGVLTRSEAGRLRGEFKVLARMEEDYRASGGLSNSERRDLDARFEALAVRIRLQKHDAQEQRATTWVSINNRQDRIYSRIDQGIRLGTITREEAARLRGEFQALVRLESEYRTSRGGLTLDERADLDRRLELLSARVTVQRGDSQSRY